MSLEEKRKVVLGIYHQTKLVYTEKEILALATKAGVNAGTYVSFLSWMNSANNIGAFHDPIIFLFRITSFRALSKFAPNLT